MNNIHFSKKILIIILFILFSLLVFSVFFSIININNTKILNGIYINGVDVSNLSKENAIEKISNIIKTKKENDFVFLYPNDTSITVPFEDFDVNYNIASCVNEAYNIGRSKNIFQNNIDIFFLYFNKKNVNLDIKISNEKLNNIIKNISSNISNKLIPYQYYIDNNKLIITKGISGNDLDINLFNATLISTFSNICSTNNTIAVPQIYKVSDAINVDSIYQNICHEPCNAYFETSPLKIIPEIVGISFDKNLLSAQIQENPDANEYEIEVNYTQPQITLNDLDINIFKDKLSMFSTKYQTSNIDRTTNLKLAAEKINGIVLSPNEEFSYNKTVGARTIDAGYKEAKIYSNGNVVDGIGGGICQISSCLYNSVILANLSVTERHSHQFLTSYVPAGRDATVSYSSKDFKFKNTRSYPIKIEFIVENGTVTCAIYGIKESEEYDVDFDIETISSEDPPIRYEQDDSLSYGMEKVLQMGSMGTVVKVYRVLKKDGNFVSKTLLSQDSYDAMEKVILRNENVQ